MTKLPPGLGPIVERLCVVPVMRDVVAGLDAAAIDQLEREVEWCGVPGGTTLFAQGDAGKDVYVLLGGRLGVQVDRGLGTRLVHRTLPGELVGEMALIAHEPRSATIVAMRDSEVLRIPGDLAEALLAASLPFMAFLLVQLVARLKTTTLGGNEGVAIETIAVLPIDTSCIDDAAAALIAGAFGRLARAAEVIDERDAGTAEPEPRDGVLRAFVARERGAMWGRQSLRQADRVLFVAHAGSRPDDHAIARLARLGRQNRPADLMLVNPAGTRFPSGATEWLALFAPDQIFHVAAGDAADYARVARLVAGEAVGVALAGGGARGFAHIGAIRALQEAGIPVDMVCGTSMGGLVGGSFAIDVDLAEVGRKVHHSFVLNKPIGDYTLPLVSLSRGRRMSALLRHHFGDVRIENCWRTFFCVSSNLTTGEAHVHRDGLLWRALRATSSLPGIVPPLCEDGELLVDGGLMNNFPVDIMAALARGRIIGIDVSAGTVFRADEADIESRSIRWMLGPGRHKVPNIIKTLMRSGMVASGRRTELNRAAVDLLVQPELGTIDLLSFDRFEEAIEAGYRSTRKVLDERSIPFL